MYCHISMFLSSFNIWFSVTKHKNKLFTKAKSHSLWVKTNIIHIIDWDVNIWSSNILYISNSNSGNEDKLSTAYCYQLTKLVKTSIVIDHLQHSLSQTRHVHCQRPNKQSNFVTHQYARVITLLGSSC